MKSLKEKITPFSPGLEQKLELFKQRRKPIQLGSISFAGPYILAPMASICHAPFRLLMEDLGAGGTVSELISANGIIYANKRTDHMLTVDPKEQNVGIQLFGEEAKILAEAAVVVQSKGAKFVDINMGCPVRKVVDKGGGSALLLDTTKLANYFSTIRNAISIPLTIKIRTGWDQNQLNSHEVVKIAADNGVEFVAIHGRTRSQQSKLPIIGNGDLHHSHSVSTRWKTTNCSALMLARGALRMPFIFLESYAHESDPTFTGSDYWEVCRRYQEYLVQFLDRERIVFQQIRKIVIWFTAGFAGSAKFRENAYNTENLTDFNRLSEDFFLTLSTSSKQIDYGQDFLMGGHG